MEHLLLATTRKLIRIILCLAVGGLIVLLAVFVLYLEKRPDLNIWHEAAPA